MTPKAVFLSYASQDAEAVGLLGDALRAAGIEVWFDREELKHGDAWDRKIRSQIRDCALFIPVVSANTQFRAEGYFRLEWKLAVDRSHQIADDRPFLLPVVLGDVPDAAARVPDRFRDVQWTRTANGEPPAGFAARVKSLLEDSAHIAEAATAPARQRATASPTPLLRRPTVVVALAAVLVAAALVVLKPWSASTATDPVSRARALYEPWDNATREDLKLAEDILDAAAKKDAGNAEVSAAYGILSFGKYIMGYDKSAEQMERVRSASERAMRLDETSFQARMARAMYLRMQGGASAQESEKLMRDLVTEQPRNGFALRSLAAVVRNRIRNDPAAIAEAAGLLDRAIAAGDMPAYYSKFVVYWQARRYDDAEETVNRGLAAGPTSNLYRAKAMLASTIRGNLDDAAAAVGKFSPDFLREDAGAYYATLVHLWRRDGEKALKVLGSFNRDLIETVEFTGPKAYLAGEANRIAKKPVAADVEYKSALEIVESRLKAQPNSALWNKWKVRLLARLGRKAETEAALALFVELAGASAVNEEFTGAIALLGQGDALIAGLENRAKALPPDLRPSAINYFRFDLEFDPIRDTEGYQKFLASLKL